MEQTPFIGSKNGPFFDFIREGLVINPDHTL
jgi:hypothetical protein